MKLLTLPPKREKFLLLHVKPAGIEASLLGVDVEKQISLIWHKPSFLPEELEHKSQWLRQPKTIVSADGSLAFFAREPMRILSSRVKRRIEPADLENALSQGLQKMVAVYRPQAAETLGVEELDALLVVSRALSFTLDGTAVDYPPGLDGKYLNVNLEVGFTTRPVFESLQPVFKGDSEFFFTETGKAELFTLERALGIPLNLVVCEGQGKTRFFTSQSKRDGAMCQGEMTAHPDTIHRLASAEWGLGDRSTHDLHHAFIEGAVSSRVQNIFRGYFDDERERMRKEIYKNKLAGAVYIHTACPAPYFADIRTRSAATKPLPVEESVGRLGFSLDLASWPDKKVPFEIVAPFLECYFAPNHPEITRWLDRRIHWLVG